MPANTIAIGQQQQQQQQQQQKHQQQHQQQHQHQNQQRKMSSPLIADNDGLLLYNSQNCQQLGFKQYCKQQQYEQQAQQLQYQQQQTLHHYQHQLHHHQPQQQQLNNLSSYYQCYSMSDDDSGCMLDEYGWVPANAMPDTIHSYFAALPEDRIPYVNSAGERWRLEQLARQLPVYDSDARYCSDGLTAAEARELHAFAQTRRQKCLGRGQLAAQLPYATQKVYCHQCKESINADEVAITAAPHHFGLSAAAVVVTAVTAPSVGVVETTIADGASLAKIANPTLISAETCASSNSDESGSASSPSATMTYWHARCFVCVECRELLVDLVYFHHNQNVFCGRHHAELFKPRCAACDELIFNEECTEAEERVWHLRHFICAACRRPLAGHRYVTTQQKQQTTTTIKNNENDDDDNVNNKTDNKTNGCLVAFCVPCYEERVDMSDAQPIKNRLTCQTCALPLRANQPHVAQGEINWHASASCFCCFICAENLLGKRYSFSNSRLFCGPGAQCSNDLRLAQQAPPPPSSSKRLATTPDTILAAAQTPLSAHNELENCWRKAADSASGGVVVLANRIEQQQQNDIQIKQQQFEQQQQLLTQQNRAQLGCVRAQLSARLPTPPTSRPPPPPPPPVSNSMNNNNNNKTTANESLLTPPENVYETVMIASTSFSHSPAILKTFSDAGGGIDARANVILENPTLNSLQNENSPLRRRSAASSVYSGLGGGTSSSPSAASASSLQRRRIEMETRQLFRQQQQLKQQQQQLRQIMPPVVPLMDKRVLFEQMMRTSDAAFFSPTRLDCATATATAAESEKSLTFSNACVVLDQNANYCCKHSNTVMNTVAQQRYPTKMPNRNDRMRAKSPVEERGCRSEAVFNQQARRKRLRKKQRRRYQSAHSLDSIDVDVTVLGSTSSATAATTYNYDENLIVKTKTNSASRRNEKLRSRRAYTAADATTDGASTSATTTDDEAAFAEYLSQLALAMRGGRTTTTRGNNNEYDAPKRARSADGRRHHHQHRAAQSLARHRKRSHSTRKIADREARQKFNKNFDTHSVLSMPGSGHALRAIRQQAFARLHDDGALNVGKKRFNYYQRQAESARFQNVYSKMPPYELTGAPTTTTTKTATLAQKLYRHQVREKKKIAAQLLHANEQRNLRCGYFSASTTTTTSASSASNTSESSADDVEEETTDEICSCVEFTSQRSSLRCTHFTQADRQKEKATRDKPLKQFYNPTIAGSFSSQNIAGAAAAAAAAQSTTRVHHSPAAIGAATAMKRHESQRRFGDAKSIYSPMSFNGAPKLRATNLRKNKSNSNCIVS